MTDEAAVEANTDNPLLNLTISAGPANNSGSDGKDMGHLYDVSGSLNWVNSRGSRMPFIFSMNVTTPTVAPGGNVRCYSGKQEKQLAVDWETIFLT